VIEVNINRQEVRLTMYKNARLKVEGIPKIVEQYRGDLKFLMGEEPRFTYLDRKKNLSTDIMIGQAEVLLKQIGELSEKFE